MLLQFTLHLHVHQPLLSGDGMFFKVVKVKEFPLTFMILSAWNIVMQAAHVLKDTTIDSIEAWMFWDLFR